MKRMQPTQWELERGWSYYFVSFCETFLTCFLRAPTNSPIAWGMAKFSIACGSMPPKSHWRSQVKFDDGEVEDREDGVTTMQVGYCQALTKSELVG